MKISTRGEYGFRAMLYLAMRDGADGPVTSHEIARSQSIPEPYLRQILAALGKSGLVRSLRGPQGGHSLARPSAEINLRDILIALEGHTTSVDQILSLNCNIEVGADHCVIREVLLRVREAVDSILAEISLEDLSLRQREIVDRGLTVPRDLGAGRVCLPIVEDEAPEAAT